MTPCSSRPLGSLERGLELVYGGGRVGLMGQLADAALAAGGRVHGVIPQRLCDLEVAHHWPQRALRRRHHARPQGHDGPPLRRLHRPARRLWHPRGAVRGRDLGPDRLPPKADRHPRRRRLLRPLLQFIDHAQATGFVRDAYRPILQHADNLGDLLAQLATVTLPHFVAPPPPPPERPRGQPKRSRRAPPWWVWDGARLAVCDYSSTILNSMRRFFARPLAFVLSAIGSSGPAPRVVMRSAATPLLTR
jgi:hypothetical protein